MVKIKSLWNWPYASFVHSSMSKDHLAIDADSAVTPSRLGRAIPQPAFSCVPSPLPPPKMIWDGISLSGHASSMTFEKVSVVSFLDSLGLDCAIGDRRNSPASASAVHGEQSTLGQVY